MRLAPMPAAGAPAAAGRRTGLEDDAEMREIFLEEAREVMDNARAALAALADAPDDVGELTTVRRAFHTLKGSSRMVGLKDFGEAAWACEQLYNARLADAPRADDELLAFTREVLGLPRRLDRVHRRRRAGGHDPQASSPRRPTPAQRRPAPCRCRCPARRPRAQPKCCSSACPALPQRRRPRAAVAEVIEAAPATEPLTGSSRPPNSSCPAEFDLPLDAAPVARAAPAGAARGCRSTSTWRARRPTARTHGRRCRSAEPRSGRRCPVATVETDRARLRPRRRPLPAPPPARRRTSIRCRRRSRRPRPNRSREPRPRAEAEARLAGRDARRRRPTPEPEQFKVIGPLSHRHPAVQHLPERGRRAVAPPDHRARRVGARAAPPGRRQRDRAGALAGRQFGDGRLHRPVAARARARARADALARHRPRRRRRGARCSSRWPKRSAACCTSSPPAS